MLIWTEQVNVRGLSEQPNYTRVATKPCNMKLVIGITLISVNHNSSTHEIITLFYIIHIHVFGVHD